MPVEPPPSPPSREPSTGFAAPTGALAAPSVTAPARPSSPCRPAGAAAGAPDRAAIGPHPPQSSGCVAALETVGGTLPPVTPATVKGEPRNGPPDGAAAAPCDGVAVDSPRKSETSGSVYSPTLDGTNGSSSSGRGGGDDASAYTRRAVSGSRRARRRLPLAGCSGRGGNDGVPDGPQPSGPRRRRTHRVRISSESSSDGSDRAEGLIVPTSPRASAPPMTCLQLSRRQADGTDAAANGRQPGSSHRRRTSRVISLSESSGGGGSIGPAPHAVSSSPLPPGSPACHGQPSSHCRADSTNGSGLPSGVPERTPQRQGRSRHTHSSPVCRGSSSERRPASLPATTPAPPSLPPRNSPRRSDTSGSVYSPTLDATNGSSSSGRGGGNDASAYTRRAVSGSRRARRRLPLAGCSGRGGNAGVPDGPQPSGPRRRRTRRVRMSSESSSDGSAGGGPPAGR
ncbi:hypothetical protein BU14_2409s0001 [Porphyra umbilicalis]|uniref:Uncharacterized protein n=1 Tax=Porphyra umbilicalis TaxID=2786 RepID=A0A1X6NJ78_PORUM|nr:hypothetical protein BU14_2409s0001 [Porphyra umbilicalis]|eukprot:OSX68669.1 hypothetical protein BU14_2409s0001 [Porphyra umbilicalis]